MSVHSELTVAVAGTGIMGAGIAAGFLAHGAGVVLLGRSAVSAEQAGEAATRLAAGFGAEGAGAPAGRLRTGSIDAWGDWAGIGLVIETIAEDLAAKRALFAALDARVPAGVPIGSNSSGLPISRIAEGLAGADRMFNTHYFMPAHVVPLVEVVLGERSDAGLGERVCALFAAHGKKPVLVRQDIPGFLANRIQHALMREALSLIDAGVATPEDVDLAVRYSFGFRYAAVGPIVQKEISGWDTTCAAAAAIYPTLSNVSEVPACLAERVARGDNGMKTGRGFMAWTPASMASARAGYERRLRAAFEILRMQDD